jgi:eukaryotic-like serine/threonine-protein kinase
METPRRLGRYSLLRRIARGGMGEVHLAELVAPGGVRRLVAIKLLLDANPGAQAALLSEARLAALISHPNVVQLLDAGIELVEAGGQDGVAWLAMEFVTGPSLAELFDAAAGKIPPWTAARLVADTCAALHAVHEATDQAGAALEIVHRDVTPHNILVSTSGFVKLADFGIARSALQHLLTRTGVVKGKLGYLSPEQAGGAAVDRRSDIFSLGILLWELLTGVRLFQRATESETMAAILRAEVPPVRERAPHVPPALERIAERALQKDPGARFADALEMHRALERALQSSGAHVGAAEVAQVVASIPPGEAQKALEWVRQRPASDQPQADELRASPGAMGATLGATGAERRTPRRTIAVGAAALLGAIAIATATALSPGAPTALPESPPPRPEPAAVPSPEPRGAAPADVATPEPSAISGAQAPPVAPPGAPGNRTPARAGSLRATPPASALPSPSAAPPPSEIAATGTINVSARPKWALVSVDGKTVGATPVAVSGLSPGAHVIDAALGGEGTPQRKTVDVEAGKIVRVLFVFP